MLNIHVMKEETETATQIEVIKASYRRILAATTDEKSAHVLRLALERLESAEQNGKGIEQ